MTTNLDIDSLLSAYIGNKLGILSAADVVNWIVDNLNKFDDFGDAVELNEIIDCVGRPEQARDKGMNFVEQYLKRRRPGFKLGNAESEACAKVWFKSVLENYLNEHPQKPWDVCKLVHPLEEHYNFPKWMGDLYNLCDWLEPDSEAVDCRYLEDGIRDILKTLSTSDH